TSLMLLLLSVLGSLISSVMQQSDRSNVNVDAISRQALTVARRAGATTNLAIAGVPIPIRSASNGVCAIEIPIFHGVIERDPGRDSYVFLPHYQVTLDSDGSRIAA